MKFRGSSRADRPTVLPDGEVGKPPGSAQERIAFLEGQVRLLKSQNAWLELEVRRLKPGKNRQLPSDPDDGDLSTREQQVLAIYLRLRNVSKVARCLEVSPHTIRNQLANIQRKFGVESRQQLLIRLLERKKIREKIGDET